MESLSVPIFSLSPSAVQHFSSHYLCKLWDSLTWPLYHWLNLSEFHRVGLLTHVWAPLINLTWCSDILCSSVCKADLFTMGPPSLPFWKLVLPGECILCGQPLTPCQTLPLSHLPSGPWVQLLVRREIPFVIYIPTYLGNTASWVYLWKDAIPGTILNIICTTTVSVIMVGTMMYIRWENRRRNA